MVPIDTGQLARQPSTPYYPQLKGFILKYSLMSILSCVPGKVLPASGVHSVSAELCPVQRTDLSVDPAQESELCQLQHHLHADTAEYRQVSHCYSQTTVGLQ